MLSNSGAKTSTELRGELEKVAKYVTSRLDKVVVKYHPRES